TLFPYTTLFRSDQMIFRRHLTVFRQRTVRDLPIDRGLEYLSLKIPGISEIDQPKILEMHFTHSTKVGKKTAKARRTQSNVPSFLRTSFCSMAVFFTQRTFILLAIPTPPFSI